MVHFDRTSCLSAIAVVLALLAAAGCRPHLRHSAVPEETGPELTGAPGIDAEYPRLTRAERAGAAFRAGLDAELAGDAAVALSCYRRAVEHESTEAEYVARLGLLLVRSDRDLGGKYLLEAARMGAASFALLQGLANHYIKIRRNDLAAYEFEKMLTCPELTERGRVREGAVLRLAFFLVSHYSSSGKPADAARITAFLIGRYPRRPEFHMERARYLLKAGMEATALEEVEKFESMLPGSTAAARMLALHYSDKGLYREALAQVERATVKVRADPGASAADLTRLRHFRADLLGKLKRYAEARRELLGLLAGAADDGEKVGALVSLAHLDRRRGKSEGAARRLQGAISSGISSGRLYAMLAACFEDLKRPQAAVRAYRKAQQLSPRDTGYRLSLARLLERRGRRAQAAAELRAALRVSPGDPACSGYLGYLYALEGINLEEAEQLIVRARRGAPRNGRHLAAQGWLRYRQGRVQKARKLLERAVLLRADAAAFEHLGDACFALGLWRRASYAWRRALELDPELAGPRLRLKRIEELSTK
jgi:tetratricopeptide (TPR) repeat protein